MAASKHEFTATEIKAGALVLASLIILVGFLVGIRGCSTTRTNTSRYLATFTDISGLNRGADVRFGGVKVGRVINLATDSGDRAKIVVTAEVKSEVPVNHGSVATIEQITLTSSKHLEISTGDPDAALHKSGDILASHGSVSAFGVPDLEGVTTRLEDLLEGLNVLVGSQGYDETQEIDLGELMTTLDGTLTEGTGTLRGINQIINDNQAGMKEVVDRLVGIETLATQLLEELNAVMGENREPLHASLVNIQTLTENTTIQMEELGTALQGVVAHLDDAGANASDLIETQRPALEEILLNVQEMTRNLRTFSQILADRPESLVRGKGSQGRKTKGN